MLAFAIAAALAVQPAAAPAAAPITAADPAAAEIAQLEKQWGEAFVNRDFAFIERIVAPEYRLVVATNDGEFGVTRRAEWMANARVFTHHAFTIETVDVNRAGDTAVASARGVWTVTMRPGTPARTIRFFVTDTWMRRDGRWQVIHRYSHRLGEQPPRTAGPERG